MDKLSLNIFVLYTLMSILIFYQQLHLKNFRGESKIFEMLLGISGLAGMLINIIFLIYFGIVHSWLGVAVLFLGGALIAGVIGGLVEKMVGGLFLSLVAFIGWPICAYLLFASTY